MPRTETGKRGAGTAPPTGHHGLAAFRDIRRRLHFVVEMDWWFRSQDWPGYHEILRRIIAADGPEAWEATGPAGVAL
ncbi:hypothetical protein ABT224_36980 [Streptomyces sp. NPDC001584]|uniref:hypothetical protein n=1 Tax=Streptomyces sp. NPDC001584 TaxID=3154521 RepID=UPI003333967C